VSTIGVSTCHDHGMDDDEIDFALVAWREEGLWHVDSLTSRVTESFDSIVQALRSQPGEGGVLGLISVAEEFFILLRVQGDHVRALLSDEMAALDFPIAGAVLDRLGLDAPDEDEDDDEAVPAGELGVVADFGFSADVMEMLLDDLELYPDEALSMIASRIGFGDQFASASNARR